MNQSGRGPVVGDDEMGSYGIDPRVHEVLVRCHNSGRLAGVALPDRQQLVHELARQRVEAAPQETDFSRSA